MYIDGFEKSSLKKRLANMIINEERKKDEKKAKLFVDACECYLLLSRWASSELILICVPCLLKSALKKEESEETQKEVEMALLALSCVDQFYDLRQELYLKEIKEISEYQKEHRNLTRLRYDRSLEDVIVNELHFGREAARELEELTRNMDWKKKEGEEMNKEEAKEELTLVRWLETLNNFFF
ncbi:uncharacterized protein MONOS_18167 [Monocercomonoides exilis]|uniref:uncharacterized protein n=1 Tax=Monocercomonoides exilis TaxID=2049356 RepID=UPI00355A2102|nr:hypothetical protein MONOS_18167 [Monocercomonoides exilis]